jgi:hypothetical protein
MTEQQKEEIQRRENIVQSWDDGELLEGEDARDFMAQIKPTKWGNFATSVNIARARFWRGEGIAAAVDAVRGGVCQRARGE